MEKSMEVQQKSKKSDTMRSNNLTVGYIFREKKVTNLKRYMHCNVHNIMYNSQDMKNLCPPIDA